MLRQSLRSVCARTPARFFSSNSSSSFVSIKKLIPNDAFAAKHTPRPFGLIQRDEQTSVGLASNSQQDREYMILSHLLTEFPVPTLNTLNDFEAIDEKEVPTLPELISGAEMAFNWFANTFSEACQQIRETGKTDISFASEKYSEFISPEIASCVDEQLQHFITTGLVPVFKTSEAEVAFQGSRILPQKLRIPLSPGKLDYNLFWPHLFEMIRSKMRRSTLATNPLVAQYMGARACRAELFFIVRYQEHADWAAVENKCLLSTEELLSKGFEDAADYGTAKERYLLLSVIASCGKTPLKFKLRNINESVWAQ